MSHTLHFFGNVKTQSKEPDFMRVIKNLIIYGKINSLMQTKIEIQPCPVVIAVPMRLWPVHHVCLQCTTPLLLQGRHQLTQGVACSKLYSTAAIQTNPFPCSMDSGRTSDSNRPAPHPTTSLQCGRERAPATKKLFPYSFPANINTAEHFSFLENVDVTM